MRYKGRVKVTQLTSAELSLEYRSSGSGPALIADCSVLLTNSARKHLVRFGQRANDLE